MYAFKCSLVHEGRDAHVQHPALEAARRQRRARARRRAQPPRRAARRRVHRGGALATLHRDKSNLFTDQNITN